MLPRMPFPCWWLFDDRNGRKMPQAYREVCLQVLGNKTLSVVVVALAGASAGSAQAGNYAEDLSRVYEAPQFIRAIKEACDKSHASSRAVNDTAYGAWRRRNK